MKKKQLILVASLSMVASLGIAGGVLASTANSAAAVKAEGEKTVKYVNITTQSGANSGNVLLDIDTTIDGTGVDWKGDCWWRAINVIHNNTSCEMGLTVFPADNDLIYITWDSTYPADGDTGYHHWRLDAGTVLIETSDTKYVLEKDYNWWWSRLSDGSANVAFLFQHGGNSSFLPKTEIPSFALSDNGEGGIQANNSRFVFYANYTKSDDWKSVDLGNSNAFFYSTDDSGTYSLAYNGDAEGHNFQLVNNGPEDGLCADTEATGTELFLPYFSGLNTTTGTDQFLSFYLPKGTLFGGISGGYPCFLENDYYFTVMNDKWVGGTTTSTQELIYGPVKTFIADYMHMGDTDYDGTGTGACASIYSDVKNAYNALTENQKYAFLNYSGYTDAKARLLAWAAANGDELDTSNNIATKKSSSLILNGSSSGSNFYVAAICAGALALVAGGAFFAFKKKREN